MSSRYTNTVLLITDNTMQDKPTWSISTTRGFPTSEKTEFDRANGAHHKYPVFMTIRRELQNLPKGQVLQELELNRGDFS